MARCWTGGACNAGWCACMGGCTWKDNAAICCESGAVCWYRDLLVCCNHVDSSHQFRRDCYSLVSVTQSAASGRGSCHLGHCCIGVTGVVASVQNVIHVLGDVSLLARCVAYV